MIGLHANVSWGNYRLVPRDVTRQIFLGFAIHHFLIFQIPFLHLSNFASRFTAGRTGFGRSPLA